ncbi:hypothetical protein O6H91_05G007200 [Diphasiastrum complanatum]|uniref:Uncharacterized protein n=1 Tax=Diphasiastrum complanatum TaxID=34168 RepID=A0ACC2DKD2_DIPCM|nr:hypothetical protein O6H91_05G007200 [Diphasiastrum complanatum]
MQLLNVLIRNEHDGVLVPIPQYPLYSATIALLGGCLVPYYLNEESNWSLDVKDLRKQVIAARDKGINVRGLVFINPGNPTGQCLSTTNLQQLIDFCFAENLVLFADEVYQQNIYQDDRPFVSAKKVLKDLGSPYSESVELVSFHTVSKGFLGECGQRGGYFELTNIHPQVVEELYKVASISLSPNVTGQIMMGLMVSPPKPGDISYNEYIAESKAVMESLRRRAHIMTDGFNSCENVICNFTEGGHVFISTNKTTSWSSICCQKCWKGTRCVLLSQAAGGHWNFNSSRLRIWSERGDFSSQNYNFTSGEGYARSHGQVPEIQYNIYGRIQ